MSNPIPQSYNAEVVSLKVVERSDQRKMSWRTHCQSNIPDSYLVSTEDVDEGESLCRPRMKDMKVLFLVKELCHPNVSTLAASVKRSVIPQLYQMKSFMALSGTNSSIH